MGSRAARSASVATAAFAAGAVGEYFLDPDNGKRRRHMARDRGLALVRRPARKAAAEARRKGSYAEGALKGAVHEATTSGDERDAERLNDAGLAAKVESEVFRDAGAPKESVSINVEAGVVYLRGEVASQAEIERLVTSAEAVEGVAGVSSLLHLPGEPAPMKA